MGWKVSGAGYDYTFPKTFDLRTYDRSIDVPTRAVHGRHGGITDKRATRQNQTTHVLQGIIQEPTVALTLAELDKLYAAISAWSDEVVITNLDNGRRIEAALINSNVPREPARTLRLSLTFQTSIDVFWQEDISTTVNATGQNWVNIPLGNAETYPRTVLHGLIANPTIVQGNWSFNSHIARANATAINARSGTSPYGKVAGVYSQQQVFQSEAKLSQSLGFFGNKDQTESYGISFDSMQDGTNPAAAGETRQSPEIADRIDFNQFTISGWINTTWNGNDAKNHYFIYCQADATNRINFYKNTANQLVVEFHDVTVTYDVSTVIKAGVWHYIAIKGAAPRVTDGSNYVEMFVDGGQVAASTTNPANPTDSPQTIYFATDNNGDFSADALMDDWSIWGIDLSDDQINTTLYNAGNARVADNLKESDVLLAYFDFDGTAGSAQSQGAQTAYYGTRSGGRLKSVSTSMAASEDTLVVDGGAQAMFVDNQRAIVYDESGYQVEGFIDGTPADDITVKVDDGASNSISAHKVGIFSSMNGTDQYMHAGDVHDIATDDLVLSAWFKMTESTNTTYFFNKGNSSASKKNWYFGIVSNGRLQAQLGKSGGGAYLLTGTTTGFNDGRWHHAVAVYDRNNDVKLYIDGILDGTLDISPDSAISVTNANNLRIGSREHPTGETFFDGELKDLRIWVGAGIADNGSTDLANARTLAKNPNGASVDWTGGGDIEDGWWLLDDLATETTPQDNTAGNNDLTLIGGTTTDYGTHSRTVLCYVSRNLLADPDIENGSIGGWIEGDAATVISKDIALMKMGRRAIQVQNGDTTQSFARKTATVSTGLAYVVRGWNRGATSINGASQLIDVNAQPSLGITVTQASAVAEDYRFIETVFDSPIQTLNIDFGASGIATGQSGYWDGVKLLDNEVANPGLEGSFAGSSLADWSLLSGVGSSTLSVTSVTTHSGSQAVKFIPNGDNWISQVITGNVIDGDWYEYSCWVQSDTSNRARFQVITGGVNYLPTNGAVVDKWVRLTAIQKASGAVSVLLHPPDSTSGEAYYDTVSVVHRPDLNATFAALATGFNIVPAKYGFGRLMNGGQLSFSTLIQRTDRMSFNARLRAHGAWSTAANQTPRTIFDFNDGVSALGTHHLFLNIENGRWVFGHANATIGAQATAHALDKDIQISGWINTDGTLISGTTYRAKLFENDVEIASATPAQFASSASAATLTDLYIGTDRDGEQPAGQIIDELYFYQQAIGDDSLTGEGDAERILIPDNRQFKWASTLATGDYVSVEHENSLIQHWDTSVPTLTNGLGPFSGAFIVLGRGSGNGAGNEDTLFCRQPMTIDTSYRKRYH